MRILPNSLDYNFFKSSQESDRELFFGPPEGERFIDIQDGWTMAHIMAAAGIFPSVSQARKNGYNRPIPDGFTDLRAGKLRKRITIFKEKL